MAENDPKVEEALRKMEEANKKLAAQRASEKASTTHKDKDHKDKTDKSFIGK